MPSPTSASKIPNFTGRLIDTKMGLLRLVETLGKGAYGVVYRGVEIIPSTNPKEYAVKVLRKAGPTSAEGQAQTREIVTHKICSDHPNILTLHQVLEDDDFICLVLDFCKGGDLFGAIVDKLSYCRNDDTTKRVFLQIMDAVESCHDKGIYHRDLKPDNIFLSEDGKRAFLGDFGLATDQENSGKFGCGSSYYMSPECIGEDYRSKVYNTPISDIWALGVILMNMIAGRNPWSLASFEDLHFRQFMADPNCLLKQLPISKSANEIMKRIFAYRPHDRITIPELRDAIVQLDTFFLTDEEIAAGNDDITQAASFYRPPRPRRGAKKVICVPPASSPSTSVSSASSSVGPITPVDDNTGNEGGHLKENPLTGSTGGIIAMLSKAIGAPYNELMGRLDNLVAHQDIS